MRVRRFHWLHRFAAVALLGASLLPGQLVAGLPAIDAYNIGRYHAANGDFGSAIRSYSDALRMNPRLVAAYVARAKAYLKCGQPQLALDDLNIAVKLSTQSAELYTLRGRALSGLGRHHEALADLSRALECDARFAEAYLRRSQVYASMGQLANVDADVQKAHQLDPFIDQREGTETIVPPRNDMLTATPVPASTLDQVAIQAKAPASSKPLQAAPTPTTERVATSLPPAPVATPEPVAAPAPVVEAVAAPTEPAAPTIAKAETSPPQPIIPLQQSPSKVVEDPTSSEPIAAVTTQAKAAQGPALPMPVAEQANVDAKHPGDDPAQNSPAAESSAVSDKIPLVAMVSDGNSTDPGATTTSKSSSATSTASPIDTVASIPLALPEATDFTPPQVVLPEVVDHASQAQADAVAAVRDKAARLNLLPKRSTHAAPSAPVSTASTSVKDRARQCLAHGTKLCEQGNYSAACAELTTALALDPNLHDAYSHRARAYLRAGKPRQAIEDYHVVIRTAPSADALLGRAQAYELLEQFDAAFDDVRQALQMRSNDADGLAMSQRLEGRLARPSTPAAATPAGEVASAAPATAAPSAEAEPFDPHARLPQPAGVSMAEQYYQRGLADLKADRADRAIANFGVALRLQPDLHDARLARGRAQASLRNYHEALADLDAAIAALPGSADAYCARAEALVACRAWDQACDDVQIALRLDPQHPQLEQLRSAVLANLPATQPTAPASVISDEPSVLATGAGVNSAEPVQVSDAVGMPIPNGPLPTASDEEPVSPVRGEFDNGKIQPAVPSGTSEGESVRPVSTQAGEGQEVAPVRMKLSARLSPDNSRPFLSPAAAPPASRALPAQAENSAVRRVAALEPQMGGGVTRAVHQVDDFRGAQPQMAVHAAEAAPRQTVNQADPAAECRTRGQLHLIQGRVDQALAEFTQAIALAPGDAANHRARADAYQASGNLAAAYDDLTEAIRLNPNDAASLLKRGMNAIERQLSTRAAVDFDAAVRLEPANSQALLGRGMAYRRLGQNRMAIDDLNEALRLDPALSLAADELKLAREALEAR